MRTEFLIIGMTVILPTIVFGLSALYHKRKQQYERKQQNNKRFNNRTTTKFG